VQDRAHLATYVECGGTPPHSTGNLLRGRCVHERITACRRCETYSLFGVPSEHDVGLMAAFFEDFPQ
jgi:hypothetical protein